LKKFEEILAECIDDITAGRSSVEDCLYKYPSVRAELEPLLRISLAIRESPDVKPPQAFKVRSRVWLMSQIHQRQAATRSPWFRSIAKPVPYMKRFATSMAGVILAIVLAISGLGVGTAYAAQGSLPGDALYSFKMATEQAEMMFPGDDVVRAERALNFADKRVQEMMALAEKGRLQDLDLAVQKYDYALAMALTMMERAGEKGLATANVTALVAETTTRHLSVLDEVWDMVPAEASASVAHAENLSKTGYLSALAALAVNDALRAAQINFGAAEGRLNRIRARVQNAEALQIALQQFEVMSEFGEEISRIAHEGGDNAEAVDELIASETSEQLEDLAQIWDMAPEQARPAIERVMANLQIRHQQRVRALEQMGAEVPPSPVIPERIQERLQEQKRTQEQQKEGISGQTAAPDTASGENKS
jgi:Domain of unknown function (DUF5667)